MSAPDLPAAYAPCRHAVAFCELFIGANDLDRTDLWADLRRMNARPEVILEIVRQTLVDAIREDTPGEFLQALEEMQTGEFRAYVRAKMGAV